MAHLLRFRSTVRTVRLDLPDGTSRLVKVTINDAGDTQHVEDGDAIHGTARPAPVAIRVTQPVRRRGRSLLLRNMGMPRMRQQFAVERDTGIWAPVPGTEVLHGR